MEAIGYSCIFDIHFDKKNGFFCKVQYIQQGKGGISEPLMYILSYQQPSRCTNVHLSVHNGFQRKLQVEQPRLAHNLELHWNRSSLFPTFATPTNAPSNFENHLTQSFKDILLLLITNVICYY